MATRSTEPFKPATHDETIRIDNTDSQGHGDYANAFLRISRSAVKKGLARAGVEHPPVASHTYTNYNAELFPGDMVHAEASIVGKTDKHIAVRRTLHAPHPKKAGKQVLASDGYSIYANDASHEVPASEIHPDYMASVNGYVAPKADAPEKALGTEIELTPDEKYAYTSDHATGSDGYIHATGMFKILHTFAYEKALTEGTGEGFDENPKKGKPVMSNSSVIVYRPLKENQDFRVFVYTDPDPKRPGSYSWTGTITDTDGNICAVSKSNHALLALGGGFKKAQKEGEEFNPAIHINPQLLERLQQYKHAPGQEYGNLLDRGHLEQEHVITRDEAHGVTASIDVQGEKMNVVTPALLNELELSADDATTKGKTLVLQSTRDTNFVAGANIKNFYAMDTREEMDTFSREAQATFNKLAAVKSSVAVVNGYALGGGLELAMTAKERVATPDAQLGLVETLIGVVPAFDGFKRLSGLVGTEKAMRLILSGQMLGAEDAKNIGLVDHVSSNRLEIEEFIKSAEKRTTLAKRSKTKHDNTSSAEADLMLDGMSEKLEAHREEQLAVLQELQQSGEVTEKQADNIGKWMQGVYNARIEAIDVMKMQLRTDDPQEKSDIERRAFADIALTPESKFATKFWVLEAKNFKEERAIIDANPILKNSGLELTAEELKVGRGQAA